jgi:hypothetical protein
MVHLHADALEDKVLEIALHVLDRQRMLSAATSTASDFGPDRRIAV